MTDKQTDEALTAPDELPLSPPDAEGEGNGDGYEAAAVPKQACWACRIAGGLVAVALTVYLATGVYIVKPNEVGVVRRFGKVVATQVDGKEAPKILLPGLHYRLPAPMTRLDLVRPSETKTVTIGFEQVDALLGREADPRRSEFLTGDQNIIQLRLTVQYTIDDPVAFLFGAANPEAILRSEAEGCLARAVASIGVDALIGPGRVRASADVRRDLDREIELHSPGVRVSAVSLQAPTPPQQVAEAFNDVQSAKAERDRSRLEAEGYRNGVVTRAYGEAEKMMREGEAYHQRRIAEAEGEAQRFEGLYEEYSHAKEVTALRLYIEAMEEILPRMRKVFVDANDNDGPIDLSLFDVKP